MIGIASETRVGKSFGISLNPSDDYIQAFYMDDAWFVGVPLTGRAKHKSISSSEVQECYPSKQAHAELMELGTAFVLWPFGTQLFM